MSISMCDDGNYNCYLLLSVEHHVYNIWGTSRIRKCICSLARAIKRSWKFYFIYKVYITVQRRPVLAVPGIPTTSRTNLHFKCFLRDDSLNRTLIYHQNAKGVHFFFPFIAKLCNSDRLVKSNKTKFDNYLHNVHRFRP